MSRRQSPDAAIDMAFKDCASLAQRTGRFANYAMVTLRPRIEELAILNGGSSRKSTTFGVFHLVRGVANLNAPVRGWGLQMLDFHEPGERTPETLLNTEISFNGQRTDGKATRTGSRVGRTVLTWGFADTELSAHYGEAIGRSSPYVTATKAATTTYKSPEEVRSGQTRAYITQIGSTLLVAELVREIGLTEDVSVPDLRSSAGDIVDKWREIDARAADDAWQFFARPIHDGNEMVPPFDF